MKYQRHSELRLLCVTSGGRWGRHARVRGRSDRDPEPARRLRGQRGRQSGARRRHLEITAVSRNFYAVALRVALRHRPPQDNATLRCFAWPGGGPAALLATTTQNNGAFQLATHRTSGACHNVHLSAAG